MRIATIPIYTFDELSDKAKEKAREDYRVNGLHYDWWDSVYEDAKIIGKLLGIEIENIYFSGFWSQGDGARFEGGYYYKKGSVKSVTEYAPKHTTLHQIARDLQEAQRRSFYQLSANIQTTGRYEHSGCTTITVFRDGYHAAAEEHDAIAEPLRALMDWIYRQLETEYTWLTSDEQVDETITANEWEFHADGSLV